MKLVWICTFTLSNIKTSKCKRDKISRQHSRICTLHELHNCGEQTSRTIQFIKTGNLKQRYRRLSKLITKLISLHDHYSGGQGECLRDSEYNTAATHTIGDQEWSDFSSQQPGHNRGIMTKLVYRDVTECTVTPVFKILVIIYCTHKFSRWYIHKG